MPVKYTETCRKCGLMFETDTSEQDLVCQDCQWEAWNDKELERQREFPGDFEDVEVED